MVTDDAEALPEAQFPQRHTSAFFLILDICFSRHWDIRSLHRDPRSLHLCCHGSFIAAKTSLELSPQPLEEVVISLLSPEGARHGILHRDVDLHIGYPAFAEPGVRRVEKFGADPRAAPMDGDLRDAPVELRRQPGEVFED